MIRNYLTVALRNMLRYKGYSAINVLGLAIGLATCIVIVRYVQGEFSVDGWHANGDRIYRVLREARSGNEVDIRPQTSGGLRSELLSFPEVEKATRLWPWFAHVIKDDTKLEFDVCVADPELFEIFDFPFVKGDAQSAFPTPNSIAITESAAKRLFGHEDPIGRIVRVESQHLGGEKTVTAILKDVPRQATFRFDYVTTSVHSEETNWLWDGWRATGGFRPVQNFFLLREGADPKALEAKLQPLIERHMGPEVAKNNRYFLQAFDRVYLYSDVDFGIDWYGDINQVYQFAAIALLVLAIGCINFANLATARSAGRAKEVGLRKVAGAVRSQLVGQFLGESILTAVFALVIALGLVVLVIDDFNAFFDRELTVGLTEPPVLLGLAAITVVVGVAAGVYPALFLSSFAPTETLKGTLRAGSRGQAIRKGLVVLQFAISIVLIVGTAVIYQQMDYLRTKKLGFDTSQVVVIPIFWTDQEAKSPDDLRLADRHETIKQAFLEHPNALEASANRWASGGVRASSGTCGSKGTRTRTGACPCSRWTTTSSTSTGWRSFGDARSTWTRFRRTRAAPTSSTKQRFRLLGGTTPDRGPGQVRLVRN